MRFSAVAPSREAVTIPSSCLSTAHVAVVEDLASQAHGAALAVVRQVSPQLKADTAAAAPVTAKAAAAVVVDAVDFAVVALTEAAVAVDVVVHQAKLRVVHHPPLLLGLPRREETREGRHKNGLFLQSWNRTLKKVDFTRLR